MLRFSCCVKPLMAVMSLQGAALINAKHSSYSLINTKLPISGTKLRSFTEQFLYMLLLRAAVIRPGKKGREIYNKSSLEIIISANQQLVLCCVS